VQGRRYVLPSATSRKEVPAAFVERASSSRKRGISEVDGGDGDEDSQFNEASLELDGSGVNPDGSLKSAIALKRLQNTHAARRSRARKLEYLKGLEDEVKLLREENGVLRGRVEGLEGLLNLRGREIT